MFIEKLSRKDIFDLIRQINNCDFTIITKISKVKNRIIVTNKNITTGYHYIYLEDFQIKKIGFINECTNDREKTVFKEFMYKKFGNKYKEAFNNNLRNKYESKLESKLIK